MRIEVTLDGYKYYYQKSKEGNRWLGVAGYNGSMGRRPRCAVPTSLWNDLSIQALKEGYSESDLRVPDKEKKTASKRVAKKKDSNSIFIF